METLKSSLNYGTMCTYHRKMLSLSSRECFGVVFVIFSFLFRLATSYNLDLDTVVTHSGETKSMFGFSVSLHQDQGSKWLLVGAPRAQTSQPGVVRGGAVFRCAVESTGRCQEIPFDTKGNGIRFNGSVYRDVEDKSNQWFGASLYSAASDKDSFIVACAPRYVYYSTRLDKREPVGTCYMSRSSSTQYEEYSPCRSRVDGLPLVTEQFHRQGSCQLGLSASLTSQGRQLLIGAVGSWYWQGQLFNFNFENGPGRYTHTSEGRSKDDYSYMGYSTAVGNFDSDTKEDYVVGVPRGRSLNGMVAFYTQNLTLLDTIKGEQFGSYFGYSVAVSDLNQDGLDDVIVGAPLFSDYAADDSYETGRVYIFYQNSKRQFSRRNKDILDGIDSQSRFGLSVASIGDVDYDGFNDIAIGAPYGGEDKRGVVYIYHGSVRGVFTDAKQVIKAEEVMTGIETFGWSLSGGLDMDINYYPDLLVGAYESNKAFLIKSRPVVRVTPSISIEPQNISLERDPSCVLQNQERVTCITVYTCLFYDGIGVPPSMEFKLTWTLDSLNNDSSRVYLMSTEDTWVEQKTITLSKNNNECSTVFAYLVNNVRDKLTPIVADFKFDIVEEEPSTSRQRRSVTPILNQRIPTRAQAEANIMKDCGPDNLCIPDLAVTAIQTRDHHTLGEDKKIEQLVFIENRGEDSFESLLKITFPPGVNFYKIGNKKYEIPIFCDSSTKNESYITCDLGNPLPRNSKTNFTLISTPKNISGDNPDLVFVFKVNSSNPENGTDMNNMVEVKLPIQQAADLNIGGNIEPEQIVYNDNNVRFYRENGGGPVLQHEYLLSNKGPSGVKTSMIQIAWPSHDDRYLPLLQLTERRPVVSRSDVSCLLLNGSTINAPDTTVRYQDADGIPVVTQPQLLRQLPHINNERRHTREATATSITNDNPDKRDVNKRRIGKQLKRIGCDENLVGCTYIQCTVGNLEPQEYVSIKIKSKISTSTLINKRLAEPFYFVSKARAEVLQMPYPDMKIAPSTMSFTMYELNTYVNPEKLHPKRTGIQPWIIGVAISVGFLLLLLLTILLWWCGFFRRRRPEEQAYLVPQNGDFKTAPAGNPESRYLYN